MNDIKIKKILTNQEKIMMIATFAKYIISYL
jgi:hypothetical protein